MRILSKPVTKSFVVEDPEGNWTVGFRQLTKGDEIEIGDFGPTREYKYDDAGNYRGIQVLSNNGRAERRAVYRTMTFCELKYDDETLIFDSQDGLVRKAMKENQFNERWDLLPLDIAQSLLEKFYEMNPAGE